MMARLGAVIFFLAAIYNLGCCHRYGIRSGTLHAPAVSEEEKLGNGFQILEVPNVEEGGGVLSRRRRQAPSSKPQISPNNLTHLVSLLSLYVCA